MSEFYGRGWSFPIKLSADRPHYSSGEDKIYQSIWIILSTAPGERQMLPEFGCGIYDLVFEPNSTALRRSVESRVRDALIRWEPRIDVDDIRTDSVPGAPNQLLIRVDYRIRSNNALYNLVYPFYLDEGPA